MERFVEKQGHIYDNQYDEYLCKIDETTCKHAIKRLNELEESCMKLSDVLVKLQNEATDYRDKYENILKLIDIRIAENKQLALLHFPEPGDEYINEYDKRAYELEQLKEMILHGK